jgi:D-arabinose 1-dehydrogenase-like Zn-dependent alcohol dehydrogenase
MKRCMIALTLLALLPGCLEGTESATTYNSSGGTSTGTVIPRSDGGYALTFTAEGNSCSAVFSDVRPGGLSPVTCTGTGSGNATMVYAADGSPDRVTFGGLGIGSGTLVF